MATNILPSYEVSPLDQAIIPPRSRLYALEPVGVGTPLVESLTSYLTRLAHTHGVTVEKLAAAELAPLVNKSEKMAREKFSAPSRNLNGISGWTPLTIEALESLTLRADLPFLTMYAWRNVLSRHKLLRHRLAWCPRCYQQWRQEGRIIYTPLLWTLHPVQICLDHRLPLYERCPYPDCQKQLRLINSRVKLGYCPFCKRWLGDGSSTSRTADWSSDEWRWQVWLANQVAQLLAAAPGLARCPEQYIIALNLKNSLARVKHDSVQELARELGISPSPLFGWMNRGHHPPLEMLARVCYHLDLSLLDMVTPQPGLDYEQLASEDRAKKQAKSSLDPGQLRQRVEQLLNDPHWSPTSASQVAQQLGVGLGPLKRHCPDQYRQILQRNEQHQQAQRQRRDEQLAQDLRALLNSEERPPPSVFEVARRLQINPRTARAICPELCEAISSRREGFFAARRAAVEARLEEILAANEQPPPTLNQVATRVGQTANYLYLNFPTFCRAITRRSRHYQPPPPQEPAPQPTAGRTKSKNREQLRHHFTVLMTTETVPPPSLAEVSRQLACGVTTLRKHCPDLCQQLRQRWDAYRQQQHSILESKVRQILAAHESPSPPVREVAQRLEIDVTSLKQILPDLYAEVVRRHQAQRQAERQRRQAFLAQIVSENPVPSPSLSQVADSLGCAPSSLQRRFPEASEIIVARYRARRDQERIVAQAALEAVLTDTRQPPLSLLQVAQQLGYEDSKYLLTYFPKLCHQLCQRHAAHKRQMARAGLEAYLVEPLPEPPLTLAALSRQFGYQSARLKHLCPDLCQAVEDRYQSYWEEKKKRLKQTLEAILSDERTPPVSVNAVAREFGYFPDTIRRYFPDLAKAVSARYKIYARQRGEERRRQLDEQIKGLARELYQAGIDPTLRQISLRLPHPKVIITPHVRQALGEARNELGLPT